MNDLKCRGRYEVLVGDESEVSWRKPMTSSLNLAWMNASVLVGDIREPVVAQMGDEWYVKCSVV